MDNTYLIEAFNTQLKAGLSPGITEAEILMKLSEWVNHLIETDFQKLIFLLYKTDVSEIKLKKLLKISCGEDAGTIIAKLLIEREQQKVHSRNQSGYKNDIPDEERW